MSVIQIYLNRVVNALKWPIAGLLLATSPWFAAGLMRAAWALLYQRTLCVALIAGGLSYWGLYHWVWRKGTSLEWFFTLQHEMEHALFA